MTTQIKTCLTFCLALVIISFVFEHRVMQIQKQLNEVQEWQEKILELNRQIVYFLQKKNKW
jgi:hypothetical protein